MQDRQAIYYGGRITDRLRGQHGGVARYTRLFVDSVPQLAGDGVA
jgi:hypothetical protein